MGKYWYLIAGGVFIFLFFPVGRYIGSIGVGLQFPWRRPRVNAERSAAQSRLELAQLATNPTMVIAEQLAGDQGVKSLHKLTKVNRFVLPFLLDNDPSYEENSLLQRLTTIDVEPVTFQNKDIPGLISAITAVHTSTSERNFNDDLASLNRALEKARLDGNDVVFY